MDNGGQGPQIQQISRPRRENARPSHPRNTSTSSGGTPLEDGRFRSCFGCGVEHTSSYFYGRCSPPTTTAHLLWALFLMFVYLNETVLCGGTGGDKRAIDPKTIRKYIWPIITAMQAWSRTWYILFVHNIF